MLINFVGATNDANHYTKPPSPGRRADYCDQSVLSVCLSVSEHISGMAGPIFTNFLCISPVAVAQSFFDDVAIRYVLPVLRMTSRSAVVGRMTYFTIGPGGV